MKHGKGVESYKDGFKKIVHYFQGNLIRDSEASDDHYSFNMKPNFVNQNKN